jgi:Na+-transporting NADH:ubiquinone oxidoreductase subunit NqrC
MVMGWESLTCNMIVAATVVVHFDSNQLDKFLDKQARVLGYSGQISLFFAEDIIHSKLWKSRLLSFVNFFM